MEALRLVFPVPRSRFHRHRRRHSTVDPQHYCSDHPERQLRLTSGICGRPERTAGYSLSWRGMRPVRHAAMMREWTTTTFYSARSAKHSFLVFFNSILTEQSNGQDLSVRVMCLNNSTSRKQLKQDKTSRSRNVPLPRWVPSVQLGFGFVLQACKLIASLSRSSGAFLQTGLAMKMARRPSGFRNRKILY